MDAFFIYVRQYIYSPLEAGLQSWPSGELRLEGIEIVTDPTAADVFVCPGPLLLFQKPNDLDRFPYIKGKEERHVFFDCSDYDTIYTRKNCIFIRCNLKRFMLNAHPNSIAWSWPADNFAECIEVPSGGFVHDVSFQGWLSSKARKDSTDSFSGSGLVCDFACYSDFCGYIYETDEGIRRRREFRRSMKESRIALAPQSIDGCLPYRFFESLSAGRVPLLVGWDYNLPFAGDIPYDDFILTTTKPEKAAEVAASFLKTHSDTEILELGRMARYYWLKYLNRDDWPKLMADAVEKILGCLVA